MRRDGKQKENNVAERGENESSEEGRGGRDSRVLARKKG